MNLFGDYTMKISVKVSARINHLNNSECFDFFGNRRLGGNGSSFCDESAVFFGNKSFNFVQNWTGFVSRFNNKFLFTLSGRHCSVDLFNDDNNF